MIQFGLCSIYLTILVFKIHFNALVRHCSVTATGTCHMLVNVLSISCVDMSISTHISTMTIKHSHNNS